MAKKFLDPNGLSFLWAQIRLLLTDFVKKETGKGLSSNDYTTAERDKLAGLSNTTVDATITENGPNPVTGGAIHAALGNKVDKATGKGLSTNDFTTAEKEKLEGLENYNLPKAGASELGGVKVGAGLAIDNNGVLSATGGGVADAVDWANVNNKPDNLSDFTNDLSASDVGAIDLGAKGQANGVATLDGNGKVPSTQLPSYVDDVVEGYYHNGAFYSEADHTSLMTGESGKIYVDLATDTSYRFGGTTFVQITSTDMTAISNSEIENIINTVNGSST